MEELPNPATLLRNARYSNASRGIEDTCAPLGSSKYVKTLSLEIDTAKRLHRRRLVLLQYTLELRYISTTQTPQDCT